MAFPTKMFIPRHCGCIRSALRVMDVLGAGASTRLSCGVNLSTSQYDGTPRANLYTSLERRPAYNGGNRSIFGSPQLIIKP